MLRILVDIANRATTTVRPFGALDLTQNPGLGIGGLQALNANLARVLNGEHGSIRIQPSARPAEVSRPNVPARVPACGPTRQEFLLSTACTELTPVERVSSNTARKKENPT